MASLAQVSLIGNLGRNADFKTTTTGKSVCKFNMAVKTGYGENKTSTWYVVTLWGKLAEVLHPMLLKGKSVYVQGEISSREYKGRDGTTKLSIEVNAQIIQLLNSPQTGQGDTQDAHQGETHTQDNQNAYTPSQDEFFPNPQDSDVPF